MNLVQRLAMALTLLCTPTELLYVWLLVPWPRWYEGRVCARAGLLVSGTAYADLMEFERDL